MFKQLLVLTAACGFSMSAWAGYIQYELKDVTLSDGGAIGGSFIENTDKQAVMYYALHTGGGSVGQSYGVSGPQDNLQSAYTIFAQGPTSFTVDANEDDMEEAYLRLNFGWDAHAAQYTIGGSESVWASSFVNGSLIWNQVNRTITGGTLVEEAADPNLVAWLESPDNGNPINVIVPAVPANPDPKTVPEPGSLALLAGGAAALASLRRRARRPAKGAAAV